MGSSDAEAECFDLMGEAADVRLGTATLEPVSAEIVAGDMVVRHVVGGNEDGVLDGVVCGTAGATGWPGFRRSRSLQANSSQIRSENLSRPLPRHSCSLTLINGQFNASGAAKRLCTNHSTLLRKMESAHQLLPRPLDDTTVHVAWVTRRERVSQGDGVTLSPSPFSE